MIFSEPPQDFRQEIEVVGCYLQYDGRFVLLHRQPHKINGGKLGLPAGKVDPDESIAQAMRREIAEETGVDIPEASLVYIDSVFVRNAGHDFKYHMFAADLPEAPRIVLNPQEHQGYVWVTPAEAVSMDLIHDLEECIRTYYRI